MYVKKVEWIDKEIKEAEVEVSDGIYSVWCFSHPFSYNVGDKIDGNLEAFDIENIMKIDKSVFSAEREGLTFIHVIKGKLCENCSILSIGSINIHIRSDIVPKDLKDGDYVTAKIYRIDIW